MSRIAFLFVNLVVLAVSRAACGSCVSNPCQNNGTCILEPPNDVRCICVEGYLLPYCHHNVCSSSPCKNNGTCEIVDGKFNCKCKESFIGEHCEIDRPETEDYACANDPSSCQPIPFEKNGDVRCEQNSCLNGGTCMIVDGFVSCDCISPYEGPKCEKSPCIPNPCQNGGNCSVADTSLKYVCENEADSTTTISSSEADTTTISFTEADSTTTLSSETDSTTTDLSSEADSTTTILSSEAYSTTTISSSEADSTTTILSSEADSTTTISSSEVDNTTTISSSEADSTTILSTEVDIKWETTSTISKNDSTHFLLKEENYVPNKSFAYAGCICGGIGAIILTAVAFYQIRLKKKIMSTRYINNYDEASIDSASSSAYLA